MTDRQKVLVLTDALDGLLEHSIANRRNPKHRFVKCFTYDYKDGKIADTYQIAEDALKECETTKNAQ